MTDLADELRIIAKDGGLLDLADRAKIAQAAEEFEQTQRALLLTQEKLIEANAHRIALTERLCGAQRLKLSLSSGWKPLAFKGSIWNRQ